MASSQSTAGREEERWYLRIDAKERGPVARAELESFLRPPRLCRVMEVKCGDHGPWFTIAVHDTLEMVLLRAGVAPDPAPDEPPSAPSTSNGSRFREGVRDWIEGFFAWLIYHRLKVAVALGFVIVNAILFVVSQDPDGRNREILARYESIWEQVRGFGEESSRDDWRAFSDNALTELGPIMKELERSASVHEPVRQNLLFAGRDHLLKILKAERPPGERATQVSLFERRLNVAREQLPGESEQAAKPGTAAGPR